jgi:hypothetical protein
MPVSAELQHEVLAPPWPPSPLEAVFSATASFTTTFGALRGPFTTPSQVRLVLNGLRTRVDVLDFPPISMPFGPDITSITKVGGGPGGYLRGSMTMPLTLRFGRRGDPERRNEGRAYSSERDAPPSTLMTAPLM